MKVSHFAAVERGDLRAPWRSRRDRAAGLLHRDRADWKLLQVEVEARQVCVPCPSDAVPASRRVAGS